MSGSPFIIAEAGVNHNGNVDHAIEMVDIAADSGADCIKFQAFEPESLVTSDAGAADYQNRNTGHNNQLTLLRDLALSRDQFAKVADRCHTRGIEFLATPFDIDLLDHLIKFGMKRLKVASGELTNYPALRCFAETGLAVILSTGMAVDNEVDGAVGILREAGASQITVLQCTSIYPAPIEQTNLRAMVAMGDRNQVPFGYSDHTLGDHMAIAATALGASVLEKHFTMSRELPGPDHQASLEPSELALMIERVRATATGLGSDRKQPSDEELKTAKLVRRSWHAQCDIPIGQVISEHNVRPMRPLAGISATESIIGMRAQRPIVAHAAIQHDDVGSEEGTNG